MDDESFLPLGGRRRQAEITSRESAIKRRLLKSNVKARSTAYNSINKTKGGRASYEKQYIKGSKEGYTDSDYGVGTTGPGIPYQYGSQTKTVGRAPAPKKK